MLMHIFTTFYLNCHSDAGQNPFTMFEILIRQLPDQNDSPNNNTAYFINHLSS